MKSKDYLESLMEWRHDDRMSSLFYLEDIVNLRELTGDERFILTSKIDFWKRTLQQLMTCEDSPSRLSCDVTWIESVSVRKGLRPHGLGNVLESLCRDSGWSRLQDHLGKRKPLEMSTSGNRWIRSMVSWVWSQWKIPSLLFGRQDTSTSSNDDRSSRRYVVPISEISKAGRALLERYPITYYTDRIHSLKDVRQSLIDMGFPDPIDANLILMELKHEGVCDFFLSEEEGDYLMKIMKHSKDSINQIDKGLFRLKTIRTRVEKQSENLKIQLQSCKTRLLQDISREDRQTALLHLKKKKRLESSLAKRHQCQSTLEELWLRVQSAETDSDIIGAYEIGSETLKKFMKEYGVTVDRTEDVIEILRETMNDQDTFEIDWKSSSTNMELPTEEELECIQPELEQFAESARKKNLLDNLPAVPSEELPVEEEALSAISEKLDRVHLTESS